jgi:hypothetical protein
MSWCTNQGPSFNDTLQRYPKLSNFYSRFQKAEDDGSKVVPKDEKLKKGAKVRRKKITSKDNFDDRGAAPIYSGFGNIVNKATSAPKKQGKKLRKRRIK